MGQILPDSVLGKRLGFTSDKFEGWLWHEGDRIMISMIISLQEGQGHLSALFKAIEDEQLRIAVPIPFPQMAAILQRKGFKPHTEDGGILGPCEIWEKPASTNVGMT